MAKLNILIVEDEALIALELKILIENAGYSVIDTVQSGLEAIKICEKTHADLILMDIILKGDIDGIEAAGIIKSEKNIPIIYLSGNSDYKNSQRLLATKPCAFISKPILEHVLVEVIEKSFL